MKHIITALIIIILSPFPAQARDVKNDELLATIKFSAEMGVCLAATTQITTLLQAGPRERAIFKEYYLPYWNGYALAIGYIDMKDYLEDCSTKMEAWANMVEKLKQSESGI